MSITQFIERIQKKPEKDKHLILWVTVAVLFSIVFFVWLTTFDLSFTIESETSAIQENQPSPFESLKNMFSGVTSDIGNGYDVLMDSLKNEAQ